MRRQKTAADTAFDRIYTAVIITFLVLCVVAGVLLFIRSRTYVPAPDDAPPFTSGGEELTVSFDRETDPETGKPASYTFLLLGVDRIAGLSDTIMLVSLRQDGSISVVQLPRDTYVEKETGAAGVKLNSIYPAYGAEGLRELIGRTLCVKIDYTVIIGTDVFAKAVDLIGGVEVDVPVDMDYEDPEQDLYIHIKAGKQVLNGKDAEGFVRYRSGYATGDLGRLDAQKIFMKALLATLREKTGLSEASRLAELLMPSITTDMPLKDCLYFLELVLSPGAPGVNGLTLRTIPGKAVYSEELKTSFFVIGRSAALETVNKLLNIYSEAIPDSLFDRNRAFLKEGDEAFERVYTYAIFDTGE